MAAPIDYRNPKTRPEPGPASPTPPRGIPLDFDTLLVRTDDRAAVRAILEALGRAGIDAYESDGVGHIGRHVGLHVRASHHEWAVRVAEPILARRQRVKALPRRPAPSDV
jgi:hypothetical protein